MKRFRFIILCFTVCLMSTASQAGVVFTLSSIADGLVTIGYTSDEDPGIRGISLNVTLSDNATAIYSDIISIDPAFNAFIDYAFTNSDYELGDGHPFADPDDAGVLEDPASFFSLSMGHLDESGNQGAAPSIIENLITFRIQDGGTGQSYVTISEDPLRGGIGGDNITTVTMPQSLLVTIPEPTTLALLALGTLILRKQRQ